MIKANFVPPTHNWAQSSGITRDFIYLPCFDNSNADLDNFGNAGPSTFTVEDANAHIPLTTAPGVWTGDGAAGANPDTAYAWSYNHADFSALFNFVSGATNGIGGRALLCAFEHTTPAAFDANGSNFISYGNSTLGWKLALSATGALQIRFFGAAARALTGNLAVATTYKFLFFMDAKNADFQLFAYGGALTPGSQTLSTAVATIAGDMDSVAPVNMVVLFGNNTSVTGTPTITASMTGTCRNMLIMDGTDLTSAQLTRIAEEYRNCPNYTVPRYLGDL